MYSMLHSVSFVLLNAEYLCIPIIILVLCSGMCLMCMESLIVLGFLFKVCLEAEIKIVS